MKKKLSFAGLCAVCLLLAAVVWMRFAAVEPGEEPAGNPADESQGDVYIQTDNGDKPASASQDDITINIPAPTPEAEEHPAVFTGTEQTIQPDVAKPSPPPGGHEHDDDCDHEKPDDPALTNPAVTPAPSPMPAPSPVPPGDKKLPGFDYIPDGGEGQEIIADDMFENGNTIGIMG
jgi:hypothetical protein